MFTMEFMKVSSNAKTPLKVTPNSAGFDLFAAEDKIVRAKNKNLISTDLIIALPAGHYGRIAPRSGLAAHHFIDVGAGVIDRDYRGVVKVLLFNFSDSDFYVQKGSRIAQLIIEKILESEFVECYSLPTTERGDSGFGSSGEK